VTNQTKNIYELVQFKFYDPQNSTVSVLFWNRTKKANTSSNVQRKFEQIKKNNNSNDKKTNQLASAFAISWCF